jgi:hypothetical protein
VPGPGRRADEDGVRPLLVGQPGEFRARVPVQLVELQGDPGTGCGLLDVCPHLACELFPGRPRAEAGVGEPLGPGDAVGEDVRGDQPSALAAGDTRGVRGRPEGRLRVVHADDEQAGTVRGRRGGRRAVEAAVLGHVGLPFTAVLWGDPMMGRMAWFFQYFL